jgi:hypothetical protein
MQDPRFMPRHDDSPATQLAGKQPESQIPTLAVCLQRLAHYQAAQALQDASRHREDLEGSTVLPLASTETKKEGGSRCYRRKH